MADNTTLNPGTGGDVIATDDISGVKHQLVKMAFGVDGAATRVSASDPLPVTNGQTQPLTDAQLRALAVPVSGAFYQATQPVSGTFWQATQPVSGPLTDTQLRASAVPVSGSFFQATQPVSIASMPSTPVTGTFWQATQPVSGTFWQATQPISATQLPAALAASGGIKVEGVVGGVAQPVSGTFWQTTQPVSIASMPSTPVTGTFWQATQPVSGTVTATQGTAAALASAWPAKVTDGTTAVKVTVANAQPVSTDGALLVNAIDTFAGTALASASRGVATVNVDIVNYNGKGIRVWQDLTVLGASSVCTFSIQEKDPVSGKFITILASAATGAGINATGTAKLTVYPGLTAAANSIASDVLPMNIRIVSTVATAASTFSIGYSIIP